MKKKASKQAYSFCLFITFNGSWKLNSQHESSSRLFLCFDFQQITKNQMSIKSNKQKTKGRKKEKEKLIKVCVIIYTKIVIFETIWTVCKEIINIK